MLAALLAVLVVVLIRSSLRPAKFTPGPRNLPIIGSLLWLDVSFSIYLHRCSWRNPSNKKCCPGEEPLALAGPAGPPPRQHILHLCGQHSGGGAQ